MPETTTPETEEPTVDAEVSTSESPVVEAPVTVHDPVVMANEFRRQLKEFEASLRGYIDILKSPNTIPLFDKGEVIANGMLALRHLEDSRMRLGKCIQYSYPENKGESTY